jgi:hypothetical protein
MSRLSLLALLLLSGMFTAGAGCDEGPGIQSNTNTSNPDEPTPNGTLTSVSDPQAFLPSSNTNADSSSATARRGDVAMGDSCQSTRQCVSGLGCEGGTCVEQGELRISMIWEGLTDADLHVRNPAGEDIYYRNREGADGGQFQKDGCIASRCDATTGPRIEAVIWRGEPDDGTYEIFGLNYDAAAATAVRFEVHYKGQVENYSGSLAKTVGATTATFAFTIGASENGPGELEFVKPTEELWVRGPSAGFAVNPHDSNIKSVKYSVGNTELGTSTSGARFDLNYTFSNLGERDVTARGYDQSGMELDNDTVKMVVMNAQDGLPNPRNGAVVSDWMLAKRILFHAGRIGLYNIQVSGRNDGADALSNIRAVAQKQTARNSCYGNAPCGRVRLDPKMLEAMVLLRQVYGYSFRVTSIAGGSHSRGSRHYRGVAFDTDTINGSSVHGNRTLARQFMAACREMGATEVLGPGNAGHSGHVHCAW